MKRFVIVILVLLSPYVYSQSYIPMLDEENVWTVYTNDGLSGHYWTDRLYFNGTEVIDNKIYSKLWTGYSVHPDSDSGCRFREEAGVIYSYSFDLNMEVVLLDFNLEIGDTFDAVVISDIFLDHCAAGFSNIVSYFEVTNVSTQFIAGENRKVIELMPMYSNGDPFGLSQLWIEGIGSTQGALGFGTITFELLSQLSCFKRNGEIVFFNSFDQCELNATLAVEDHPLNTGVLFPNPVKEKAVIEFQQATSADHIRIVDIFGRIHLEKNIAGNRVLFSVENLSSGIFFYQVYSKNKLLATKKFIIE